MKAKWTVMIYMAGDNNLDSAALDDIEELAQVGSSAKVNVLVQLDRDGDLRTRRFCITKGGGYRKDCIETFGETNTGDPKVLSEFNRLGAFQELENQQEPRGYRRDGSGLPPLHPEPLRLDHDPSSLGRQVPSPLLHL